MEPAKEVNKLEIAAQGSPSPTPLSAPYLARDFGPVFLDAAACRAYLIERLHPAGPACPSCAAPAPDHLHARFLAWGRITCPGCGRTYGPTTGTILAGSNLDPRQVVALLLGLGLGLDFTTTTHLANVSRETVRVWRARLHTPTANDVEKAETEQPRA